ncbi:MAG TPA: hypothetical protein ENG30_00045 [Thermofilaceae archaeon]|nr:hypothetical protein [Thermofilaceae archaeon]
MPWLGIEQRVNEERARVVMEELALIVRRTIGLVEVKTSRGWVKFRVYEVEGVIEGVAAVLASRLGVPVFESGRHLILGEASARLWDEGVKVAFPNGDSEIIPIFTFDGFLDLRMPTSNVRGVKATMIVGGKVYELPLKLNDLLEIYSRGRNLVEKIEKAASVYGLERIVSREALESLRKSKREVRVEVDYETGFVFLLEGGRMKTIPLSRYFIELIYGGELEKAKSLYEGAPESTRVELAELIRDEYEVARSLGLEARVQRLKSIAEKLGLSL